MFESRVPPAVLIGPQPWAVGITRLIKHLVDIKWLRKMGPMALCPDHFMWGHSYKLSVFKNLYFSNVNT